MIGANLTSTYTSAQLDEGNSPGIGDHYEDKDGKVYKFVLFNNGAGNVASVAGNFAYYYLAGGLQDNAVTMDLSDSVNIGAGVFQAVIADGSYGWVQIMGKAVLTTAPTAGADGNTLTAVGSTDGTVDVSALVTDCIVAIADDISAKEVTLCCPW